MTALIQANDDDDRAKALTLHRDGLLMCKEVHSASVTVINDVLG
jgi:hypothetical protein